jgi:hypothetical protein
VRRKRRERAHAVRATLKVGELMKTGSSLHLDVYARGKKIGTLELGRGSLFWKGGGRKRRKRVRWSKFAEYMDRLAYEEPARRRARK